MATRRARIKAIVNVPARRSKANDDSGSIVQPKSPPNKETSVGNENEDSQIKEVCCVSKAPADVTDGGKSIPVPHAESTPPQSSIVEDISTEIENSLGSSAELNTRSIPIVHEGNASKKTPLNVATAEETSVKSSSGSDVSESGPKDNTNDIATEKSDQKRNSEVASVSSPLKQRSRLFIRPSPKLVDVGGRGRYPSGNRHKTLSESEDDSKNRPLSCATEESGIPVPESSSRISQSEKISDGADPPTNVPVDKPSIDNRKNGNIRSGRQRARNKENRASDSRRRLWLQMKKGNGPAGPLDRSRLTMFDYIYYNPVSNPMRSSSESSDAGRGRKNSVGNGEQSCALMEEQVDDPGEGQSLEENEPEQGSNQAETELDEGGGMPAPRVKVGPDGELIVDEQSLVIETTGLKESLEDLEKGPPLVETSSFTNYATYSKRSKGLEWSENETLRFYRALNVVGTDFSLMQNVLFPNRSRRDLKNKFKREERRNSSLIEKALRNPEMFSSVEELQTEFAKTASREKLEEGSKKVKNKIKSEGQSKRKSDKETKVPKKKRSRKWVVDGNESEADSENDANENVPSKLLDFPEKKTIAEVEPVSPGKVVTSSVDDDITMCSQEIVVTNNEYKSLEPGSDESESEQSHVKNQSDDDESVSSESQFYSRVLVPTRSGRVPKRKDVNSSQQANQVKVDMSANKGDSGRKIVNVLNDSAGSVGNEMEMIICSKEAEDTVQEPLTNPLAVELTQFPSTSEVKSDFVNSVEPGSLVVIATCSPDNPARQVLQLFMVSPGNVEEGGRVLIPQNLAGGFRVATDEVSEERVEFGSSTVVTIKNTAIDYPVFMPPNPAELSSCTVMVEDPEVESVS